LQVQKVRRAASSIALAAVPTLDQEALIERWPRRSRFLFIITAASLCWAIPAALVYWLVLPH
jgi:hypothetical protein